MNNSNRKKIIIIGAGMGGLSAAIHLAHYGHEVTVIEKNPRPGGKMNVLERDGFRFDTGPTILTMPHEIERLFLDVGRHPTDYIQLTRFDPIYRAHFRDGTDFELYANEAETLEQIRCISPADVPNYQRFMRRTARIWDAVDSTLFERLFLSWRDLFHPAVLLAGARVDAFRTMYDRVSQTFDDPRIRQLFMFQAIYVGASPHHTPATYTVIPYLEQQQGVWFPKGGLYSIVEAAMRVADELDVAVRLNEPVAAISVENGRATGVELESGEFCPADLVISNADLVHTYGELLPSSARRKYSDTRLASYDPSSSAFILYVAVNRTYPHLVHHNIYFGPDYDDEMRAIFEERRMPTDASWYICAPTRTDPALAPSGHDALYVLALAPALDPRGPDWGREKHCIAESLLDRMEKEARLENLRQHLLWYECFTPEDFAWRFNANLGSIFGLSAITRQTALFRPPNRSEDVRGLYLVGGSTQPGGGVPIVILGGRLVAQLVQRDIAEGRI